MEKRIYWMELAVVMALGILGWSYWEPSLNEILCGMVALLGLLVVLKDIVLQRIVLILLAGLFGTGRMSAIENELREMTQQDLHSVVWVQQVVGREVLVDNDRERWRMRFYGDIPSQGSLIGVWHKPIASPIPLKGALDKGVQSIMARRPLRSVIAWETIREPERIHRPELLNYATYGGIIWALVSGDKSGIDKDTKQLMRNTGTSHLLAISGMHIGLLAVFAYGVVHTLLGWLAFVDCGHWVQRIALCASILAAWLYGMQVGWPASAQRAVLMVSLFSMGKMWEVDFSLWSVLGLSAMVMMSTQPDLVYDLGFQLSYAAVIGIGGMLDMTRDGITKYCSGGSQMLMLSMVVSAGASLGTLPLCAWVFQTFPSMGIVANVFAGPLMGTLAVPLSMIGVIVTQQEWFTVGCLLISFADACIALTMMIMRTLNCGVVPLAMTYWEALTTGFLVCGVYCGRQVIQMSSGVLLTMLCIQASPLERYWRFLIERGDELQIRFMNVGQGDATLVEWSDGRVWLVDGGPFSFEFVPYLKREGIWHIDQVWLSHPHADHMEGLNSVLQEIPVDVLVVGRMPEESDSEQFAALIHLAKDRGVEIRLASQTQEEGVRVLHPHDWIADGSDRCNEESVVLEVTHHGNRVLLTGDIEEDAEAWLLNTLESVSILKVAHHGSRSSSSPDFITRIQPEYAVIPVGLNNRFHHPHPSTLWNLRNSNIWRTDIHGTVVAQISPRGIRMHSE